MTPIPGQPTAASWPVTSRNTRRLALNLQQADGRAVLSRLLAAADGCLTNVPLPVRERWQIAPAQVLGAATEPTADLPLLYRLWRGRRRVGADRV